MKFFVIVLLFGLCYGQETRPNLTTTEDLLAAQAQLTIGHVFAEEFLMLSRQRLSDYLTRIEEYVLNEFLNGYAALRTIGDETTALMDSIVEPSFCADTIRERWALQVRRYGQRLSRCLSTTNT